MTKIVKIDTHFQIKKGLKNYALLVTHTYKAYIGEYPPGS